MWRYVEHVRVSFVIQEKNNGVFTPFDSHSDQHQIALDEQRTSPMWTYIYSSIEALAFSLGRLQARYRKGDPFTYCILPSTYMSLQHHGGLIGGPSGHQLRTTHSHGGYDLLKMTTTCSNLSTALSWTVRCERATTYTTIPEASNVASHTTI